MDQRSSRYARIFSVVRAIPPGRVATYGQVAEMAGYPGHARQVGYALAAYDGDEALPWQRVVNAQGRVSPRAEPESEEIQRNLLRAEGIVFDSTGRLDLERFRWA
ncbi:MAG: MGMT family protein [Thermoanaerobaculia bacterium]|nr:MGMT family protein [Thermoanaerobaculia bacterium]